MSEQFADWSAEDMAEVIDDAGVPEGPTRVPDDAGEDEDGGVVLAHPSQPIKVARQLLTRWYHPDRSRLGFWKGDWQEWRETCWNVLDEQDLRSEITLILERAVWLKQEKGQPVQRIPWNPTPPTVSHVLRMLADVVTIKDEVEDGTWLDGGEHPEAVIPTRNGLLEYRAGQLHAHTPRYFSHYSLPFDYDPEARSARWEDDFLSTVWPDDEGSKTVLQEWFGYTVSGHADLEKMLYITGPRRSGKGTIADTLGALMGGTKNVAAPMLNDLTKSFGLQSLLGKPLAIVADARNSKNLDIQMVTQVLLAITGRDAIDIDRKHKPAMSVRLPTRFVLMSNEMINFKDASHAITGRMIPLQTEISFFGREDKQLKLDVVKPEALPGVLNWAIAGLLRLEEQGKFTEPESTRELRASIEDDASPVDAFIDAMITIDPDGEMVCDDGTRAWDVWNGKDLYSAAYAIDRRTETTFWTSMKTALAARGVKITKVRRSTGGKRCYSYVGIRFASPASPADLHPLEVGRHWFEGQGTGE